MANSYLLKIIVGLLLGMAVGFERESYESQSNKTKLSGRGSLGVRSYALFSLLGVLLGIIYPIHQIIFCLITIAVILLIIGYYILSSWFNRDIGLTTELAIVLNFFLGIFLGLDFLPTQLIIALTIILILIMSLKSEIRLLVAQIQNYELEAFISYALIALVILPFLPNKSFSLASISGLTSLFKSLNIQLENLLNLEIVNPFNLWRVVVIVTGIDIVGYVLEKTLGQKKSWLLTSIAGGFISSTSTTQSLAIRSTKSKNTNGLVAAALYSNFASFIQHLFLLASANIILLTTGIPYLLSIIGMGYITATFFYFKSKKVNKEELKETRKKMEKIQIFSLKPALKFALIFTIIKLGSKLALILFGQGGFLITIGLASFTGLDAVTLSVGEIVGKSIDYKTGVLALVFANAINLLAKTFYCFTQGNKLFSFRFGIAVLVIIAVSFTSLVFIY